MSKTKEATNLNNGKVKRKNNKTRDRPQNVKLQWRRTTCSIANP